jgi:hypothetical protein
MTLRRFATLIGILSVGVNGFAEPRTAGDGAPITQTVTVPMTSGLASSRHVHPSPAPRQKSFVRFELGWSLGDAYQSRLSQFRRASFSQGALPSLGLTLPAWRSLKLTGSYTWLQSDAMKVRKLEDPELASLPPNRSSLNRLRLGLAVESSSAPWSWVAKSEWEQNLVSQSSMGRSQSQGALVPALGLQWQSRETLLGASLSLSTRLFESERSGGAQPIWVSLAASFRL